MKDYSIKYTSSNLISFISNLIDAVEVLKTAHQLKTNGELEKAIDKYEQTIGLLLATIKGRINCDNNSPKQIDHEAKRKRSSSFGNPPQKPQSVCFLRV